ncbi:hypothetical protein JTB14_034825 [Gonioctena quinquepunctata]|nr:hypothetical protein JTB14_034825 [Gonioctena quinquepunctata]
MESCSRYGTIEETHRMSPCGLQQVPPLIKHEQNIRIKTVSGLLTGYCLPPQQALQSHRDYGRSRVVLMRRGDSHSPFSLNHQQ